MNLVIVHLPKVDEASVAEKIASRGAVLTNPVIQIASPDPASLLDPIAATEAESGEAALTAGDPAMQSMLFGRYTNQINARIQRAWRKPRGPIEGELDSHNERAETHTTFRCQARISQDGVGNVTEVELTQCNGTPEWQLSLVRAIQRSSPLPAPPSPTVFTNALTLAFEGRAYTPGSREDEYE